MLGEDDVHLLGHVATGGTAAGGDGPGVGGKLREADDVVRFVVFGNENS